MIFVLMYVSFNQLYLADSRIAKILLYSLNSQERLKRYANRVKFLWWEADICVWCVCVHMCLSAYVHWYVCTQTHMCGPEVGTMLFTVHFHFIYWGKFSCEPEAHHFHYFSQLARSRELRSPTPKYWHYLRAVALTRVFMWVLGIWTLVLMLAQQALYPLSHLTSALSCLKRQKYYYLPLPRQLLW